MLIETRLEKALQALSPKEQKFVEAYFANDGDAFKAYKEAINPEIEYRYRTRAYEFLARSKVDTAVQVLHDISVMNLREGMMKLSKMARFNLAEYIINDIDDEGNESYRIIDFDKLKADGYGFMLKGYKVERGRRIYEFHSNLDAIQDSLKAAGAFVKKVEHKWTKSPEDMTDEEIEEFLAKKG